MNASEFRTALLALKGTIGWKADVLIGINDFAKTYDALWGRIYPQGVGSNTPALASVYADDWDSLLAALRAAWSQHAAKHRKAETRRMAIEIIRLTAEFGECTDAALRGVQFSPEEIASLGPEAVEEANQIASSGPFTITLAAKANAA